ncbi:S-layer homology domain-containing protein [Ammoniphilus sp. 3BR4]|uniref:S-layer homology domain-containing protein n=1 Tax=Ammoniphilus sp. 3BR4 TaxID=3158265 RepID=UPI0034658C02
MYRKISYIFIGIIFACILSFSFISFADDVRKKFLNQENDDPIASQVNPGTRPVPDSNVSGNPVYIDKEHNRIAIFDGKDKWEFTLNESTIVYRNDQKTQLDKLQFSDQIKVVLNSSKEVRYIIATSVPGESEPHDFSDLHKAKWAKEYIDALSSKNILQGYEDGSFRPDQFIRRAEAIVLVTRFMGLDEEAKLSVDKKLYFKDANVIEQQYKWAKGYIVAALQQGLFDSSVDILQPDKPATRIWVTNLLVRSMKLQAEAYGQMTNAPNFKDVRQIPAGSIGYVNIAVKNGIINGYPDQTFRPHYPITRAELAVLLVKADKILPSQN